jgi:phage shock protein E
MNPVLDAFTTVASISSVLAALAVVVVVMVVLSYLASKSAPEQVVLDALKAGAKIIDVRTVREYNAGHYPGSINIPVDQLGSHVKKLGDPSRPIVMYCHSGMRSGRAMKILKRKGFSKAINAGSYHRIMQITTNKKQKK